MKKIYGMFSNCISDNEKQIIHISHGNFNNLKQFENCNSFFYYFL